MLSATQPACFLIADISGYTSYLAGVELDHAQDILADLIGTVVTGLRPAFRLAKLEGDAAFTYAPAEKVDGSLLLDSIERCYFGFRRRRRDVRLATGCECNACVRIPDLNLKFVVHHGNVIRQKVAGREELLGSDVILVHRLLKNSAVEQLDVHAYALITQQCVDVMEIDPAALGARRITETYDVIGEVQAWVHDLERRWQEEDARKRVYVTTDEAIYEREVRVAAPPQMVWEYVTTPGRRSGWQHGVTGVEVIAKGNRRGVGATNHCMHGKDAVIEEILDWRPYDYLTDLSTMQTPLGPIQFASTTEIEPTAEGSIVRLRFAAPRKARERAIMEQMKDMFIEILDASEVALIHQLEADAAARRSAAGEEPELPAPKPDGPFAAIGPLVIIG